MWYFNHEKANQIFFYRDYVTPIPEMRSCNKEFLFHYSISWQDRKNYRYGISQSPLKKVISMDKHKISLTE